MPISLTAFACQRMGFVRASATESGKNMRVTVKDRDNDASFAFLQPSWPPPTCGSIADRCIVDLCEEENQLVIKTVRELEHDRPSVAGNRWQECFLMGFLSEGDVLEKSVLESRLSHAQIPKAGRAPLTVAFGDRDVGPCKGPVP